MARRLRIYRLVKTPRRVVLLIISLILMVVISILIAVFGSPGKAVIVNPAQQDQADFDVEKGVSTLRGMYFVIEYRADLNKVEDITSLNHNAIEAFRIARTTLEDRRTLVVTIQRTVPGGLLEDSSYKYRKLHPEAYEESEESVNGSSAYVMARTDNTEVTAFIPHGEKTAILSYTAGASTTVLKDALDSMRSFKWL